jgi:hypothetical protein
MILGVAVLAAGACGFAVPAEDPAHGHRKHPADPGLAIGHPQRPMHDGRPLVKFPDALRVHTLANMRDHLSTLGEIQAALANGSFDVAAEVAERRLGMSSLTLHGAHDVAKYMPPGMQEAGTAMHRAASRFALVAQDASASGDLRSALASLAALNRTCVACHAAYRLQ